MLLQQVTFQHTIQTKYRLTLCELVFFIGVLFHLTASGYSENKRVTRFLTACVETDLRSVRVNDIAPVVTTGAATRLMILCVIVWIPLLPIKQENTFLRLANC